MLARILGIRRDIDFTSKKDGNQIQGTNIYVAYPEDGVEGEFTQKFFLSKTRFPDVSWLNVGNKVDLTFDYKGRIDSVTICDKK